MGSTQDTMLSLLVMVQTNKYAQNQLAQTEMAQMARNSAHPGQLLQPSRAGPLISSKLQDNTRILQINYKIEPS